MRGHTHDSISATDLVRNLALVIDKVRISGKSLYITKGSQTVAELNPPPKSGYPIAELAGLLGALPELGKEAAALSVDLKAIRKQAQLPKTSWD